MKKEVTVSQSRIFAHDWRLDRMYDVLSSQNFPTPTQDQQFELNAIERMIRRENRHELAALVTKRVIGFGVAAAAIGLALLFGEAAHIDANADIGWFGSEAGRVARVNQDHLSQVAELAGSAIMAAYTFFIVGERHKIKRSILIDQRREVALLKKI